MMPMNGMNFDPRMNNLNALAGMYRNPQQPIGMDGGPRPIADPRMQPMPGGLPVGGPMPSPMPGPMPFPVHGNITPWNPQPPQQPIFGGPHPMPGPGPVGPPVNFGPGLDTGPGRGAYDPRMNNPGMNPRMVNLQAMQGMMRQPRY